MPAATPRRAPLLAERMEPAPVFVPLVPEVPFSSFPPTADVLTGEVLLVAFAAAWAKASMVLPPDAAGGLMTPTMPLWQCWPCEQ